MVEGWTMRFECFPHFWFQLIIKTKPKKPQMHFNWHQTPIKRCIACFYPIHLQWKWKRWIEMDENTKMPMSRFDLMTWRKHRFRRNTNLGHIHIEPSPSEFMASRFCAAFYIYIYIFPCCVAPFRREAFDTKQAIRRHCVVAFLYSVYVQMSDYSQNSARETSMCLPVYGFITMSHVRCIWVYMWVSGNMCVRSFRSSSNSWRPNIIHQPPKIASSHSDKC